MCHLFVFIVSFTVTVIFNWSIYFCNLSKNWLWAYGMGEYPRNHSSWFDNWGQKADLSKVDEGTQWFSYITTEIGYWCDNSTFKLSSFLYCWNEELDNFFMASSPFFLYLDLLLQWENIWRWKSNANLGSQASLWNSYQLKFLNLNLKLWTFL